MIPNEKIEDQIRVHIDRYGHSIMAVGAGENEPSFSYTIGCTILDLPEIITFGLPPKIGHMALNSAVASLKQNPNNFREGVEIGFSQNGDKVVGYLKEVSNLSEACSKYLCYTNLLQKSPERILQLVWPDQDGNYPWDKDWNTEFSPLQICLY